MYKSTLTINKKFQILTGIIAITTFCFITLAHATIVKANHSKLLSEVSPVPSTAQEAYSKCVKDKDGKIKVNPSIEKLSMQMEPLIKENAIPYQMGNMNAGNVPQNMPTKEQLKKMTKEEKIALAMKMQPQMNTNNKPTNMQAYAKCIDLNNKFAELSSKDTLQSKLFDLENRYDSEHSKINAETEKALNACPQISGGEMSAPDQKCIKAKKLAGVEKHIALTQKYLGELKTILAGKTNRIKGLVAELDKLMSEVNYGAGVEDSQTKTMLNQAQGFALNNIFQIQALVQNAYTSSAAWIFEKQEIAERQ